MNIQVTTENFVECLKRIRSHQRLAIDTETTGLRPFHGDRLFAIIVSLKDYKRNEIVNYYFDFNDSPGGSGKHLFLIHKKKLASEFGARSRTWFLANAVFDLAMLGKEGIKLSGTIHDVISQGRVLFNDYLPSDYSLDGLARKYDMGAKKDAVKAYINEHELYTKFQIPGKDKVVKYKHFDLVPFPIMFEYGCHDGELTFRMGEYQEDKLQKARINSPDKVSSIFDTAQNENKLTRVVHRMKEVGVKIDREYTERAAHFEQDRIQGLRSEFAALTGFEYKANSSKLFQEVFKDEKDKWQYTEKGNPSFDKHVIKTFTSEVAGVVKDIRAAKANSDFYHGFLYHADSNDIVHPDFLSHGTSSGRFSSKNPNFQNLKKDEDEALEAEFVVRRCIIPRPGYILLAPDYDQLEYRLMLDYAARIAGRETELIQKIKGGLDVHTATAELVAKIIAGFKRKQAKTVNFGILYGQGLNALAAGLNVTYEQARAIRTALFRAAPEILQFIDGVTGAAMERGYAFSWTGRRHYLSDRRNSYRIPNQVIQGGGGDCTKVAMVKLDAALSTRKAKSRILMNIHDELVIECHQSEVDWVPEVTKQCMETVYPHQYLPLTVGMSWSATSLADKTEGFPTKEVA